MESNIVPLSRERHGNKRIIRPETYLFAKTTHMAPILVNEFTRAAANYPIVFLKTGDEYMSYAMLGLTNDENLFVDEAGRWDAAYVPAVIRRAPFASGKKPGSDDLMVCIDERSEFLSETEGEPLFDESGQPGTVVKEAQKYLADLHGAGQMTERFCRLLAEKDLLNPLNWKIKGVDGASQNITGAFAVNEGKFNALSDDDFLSMRKSGAIQLIYAHMLSLPQIDRLLRKRDGRNG